MSVEVIVMILLTVNSYIFFFNFTDCYIVLFSVLLFLRYIWFLFYLYRGLICWNIIALILQLYYTLFVTSLYNGMSVQINKYNEYWHNVLSNTSELSIGFKKENTYKVLICIKEKSGCILFNINNVLELGTILNIEINNKYSLII